MNVEEEVVLLGQYGMDVLKAEEEETGRSVVEPVEPVTGPLKESTD